MQQDKNVVLLSSHKSSAASQSDIKEILSSYLGRGLEMPGKKYEERKRVCALCSSIVLPESSQVSTDDRFAALQIDLDVRGV